MMDVTFETVLGKLNRIAHTSFYDALRHAQSEGHRNTELVHWLFHILQNDRSDISVTLDHYGLDRGRVLADMQKVIGGFRTNQTERTRVASGLSEALDAAWRYATLMFGEMQIRTGHVLMAMMREPALEREFLGLSGELKKLSGDAVAREHAGVWAASDEESLGPAVKPEAGEGEGKRGSGALDRFTQDLTAEARSGKMDPIVGRDEEIRQIVDVLMRRRQNNPILTGDAGVGKTAVVEGFAQAVVAENVPPPLRGVRVLALDVGLLQAGASMKGEFEQRLRSVIDEVQASPVPVILFIDEAHTLIGAGGQAGTGDAANLLKPPLARGTLRTIAATTWSEYRQYIEKDPALTRRFQPVSVDQPDVARCCTMVRSILAPMEKHHDVRISDEAVVAAVTLSDRYIPARQLPDKAVSLLDTAAARVAVSQSTKPASLADIESEIAALDKEAATLEADKTLGHDGSGRLAAIAAERSALAERAAALTEEWEKEKALVGQIVELRQEAAGNGGGAPSELSAALDALASIDPEKRLIHAHVDEEAVASVVSDWTGIPVGRMVRDEIEAVLSLTETLERRVVGQTHGLAMIARRVETSRAGLDNPNKPVGVFMLCGPSGVGKTETALALAEQLYGGEQNVITINMSEFQEAHTVSALKGAPPGYVGYGEGGRLTEAVRRRPYSVVLLDEVEKAHPDVHEVFFQVFDKGQMEDGTGRLIDFKNTLIMLTSNVGTDLIMSLSRDPYFRENPEALAQELRDELLKVFPAALLGRMVVIPYYPLSASVMRDIVHLHLSRVERLVRENQEAAFVYEDSVLDHVVSLCNDPGSGGRMIDNIITNTLLPALSREFLRRTMTGEEAASVTVGVRDGAFVYAWNGERLPEPAADPAPETSAEDATPAGPTDGGPGAPASGEPATPAT